MSEQGEVAVTNNAEAASAASAMIDDLFTDGGEPEAQSPQYFGDTDIDDDAGDAPAEEVEADGAGDEPPPTDDVEVDAEGEPVPWGKYKALKNENANLRGRVKHAEAALNSWDDYSQGVWLNAMQLAANDPAQGASMLREIADSLAPAGEGEQASAPVSDEPTGDPGEAFTPEKIAEMVEARVSSMFAERERDLAVAEQQTVIAGELRELGLEPGSEEAEIIAAVALMLPNGSVKDAHAKIKAMTSAQLSKTLQEADDVAATLPKVASGQAPGAQQVDAKDFADARKLARQMLS
jgi:hypothetical protein